MWRSSVFVCTFSLILSTGTISLAGTWCDNYPTSVLCEDYDSYCSGFNDPCPGGAGTGTPTPLRHAWPNTSMNYHLAPASVCGLEWFIEENQSLLTSAPFGGRWPNEGDEAGTVGQASRSLVPGIQAQFGSQYDVILGTDANPLLLRFNLSGGLKAASKLQGSNAYMELALEEETREKPGDLDPEVTPTDFVMVGIDHNNPNNPGCISCYRMCPAPDYSVSVPWPTICQSYDARVAAPACPPVPADKIHKTLAIGALALLDNNPCHCETPANQMPQNAHLSYFDGWKWRILKANLFPGNGGDFILGQKWDTVEMTIKTSTVEITHTNQTWNGSSWSTATSTATIPRLYTGAFNTLRAGMSSGCKLDNSS